MILTTTPSIEGKYIESYHGIVAGEATFIGLRDVAKARMFALQELGRNAAELGANAVIGVDLDYAVVGPGDILMVTASGTAVKVE